jgi:hypothetical protein
LEFRGECIIRDAAQEGDALSLLATQRRRGYRRRVECNCVGLGFQPLDQALGFVAGEPAAGLALVEPERSSGIPEVDVAGRVDEIGELLDLSERCGRSRRLTYCHPGIVSGQ